MIKKLFSKKLPIICVLKSIDTTKINLHNRLFQQSIATPVFLQKNKMTKNITALFAASIFIFFYYPAKAQNALEQKINTDSIPAIKTNRFQYFKPAAVAIPASLFVYSALKPAISNIETLDADIMTNVKKNHPGFKTNADGYLMWVPSASIYVMDAFRYKTKHNVKQHLLIDAGSFLITSGIGYAMRKVSGNIDVYTKQNTRYPSGHVANAFRGAEIFHQELKDQQPLLSYGGYAVAAAVGVLRIYNKNHLLTEVLGGAALGILSTKLTYWLFDKTKYSRAVK